MRRLGLWRRLRHRPTPGSCVCVYVGSLGRARSGGRSRVRFSPCAVRAIGAPRRNNQTPPPPAQVALALADPFGDDDTDFDVDVFLVGAVKNALANTAFEVGVRARARVSFVSHASSEQCHVCAAGGWSA